MASHWSSDVCILCWRDPRSNGRMRMSWGTREECEQLACDKGVADSSVLYSGFGAPLHIRPAQKPVTRGGNTAVGRRRKKQQPAKKRRAAKKKPQSESIPASGSTTGGA